MTKEIKHIKDVCQYISGLKCVLFDLDDTLYSEKEYVLSGFCAIANAMPQIDRMEEKLWGAFLQNKSAIDEVLISEGVYTEELKQKCLSVYRFHKPNIHFYEGARELLEQLRNDGYKTGIITDGRPEGQRAKIKALKLEELVDHIIVTDELGGIEYRKPNKAAFVKMKEHFNVNYNEMLYIGDNIKKDFIAPELLGMKSICLKNENGIYA